MNAWPDAASVRAFLARTRQRLVLRAALQGAAVGCVSAALLRLAAWLVHWPDPIAWALALTLVALGAGAGAWSAVRSRARTAYQIEALAPQCRNLLITASELIDNPRGARPDIGALVCRHAAAIVAGLDVAALFPIAGAASGFAVAAALLAVTSVVAAAGPVPAVIGRGSNPNAAILTSLDITVVPPAYARRASETLRDPARVDVLAGTTLHVTAHAEAAAVSIETLAGVTTLTRDRSDAFSGDVVVDRDGYLAIWPSSAAGTVGARRLVGLGVEIDRAPLVRVSKPGRDLFLPNPRQLVALEITAEDDLALIDLRLTYTKVTGSGENVKFAEDSVPVRVTRTNERQWTATADWSLAPMALEAGDVLVYRGVASDSRPGAAAVESDAFIIEIVRPDAADGGGFAIDDHFDKYAFSEQMIILKTERLAARRSSMTAEAFAEQALDIAAEQRQVRAMFVFMLGGELEDANPSGDTLNEEAEAAGEADLAAGRLRNEGRVALLSATRHMGNAAAHLAAPNTTLALTSERSALVAIQRAFSKSRYLLRTLSLREQIDLTRRLLGALNDVSREPRTPAAPVERPADAALRRTLADLATLASRPSFTSADAARATTIAESVLKIDPSSKALQQVASRLTEAAAAIGASRAASVPALLDQAAFDIAALARAGLPEAPVSATTPDLSRLNGALADALRARGAIK